MRSSGMDEAHDNNPFSLLDAALLAEVLRHVPLQQRAASCSRVSSTWHEAAWQATTDVDVGVNQEQQMSLLSSWLQAHPNKAAIKTLKFEFDDSHPAECAMYTLQMPFYQLRGLQTLKALNSSIEAAPSFASSSLAQLSDSAVSGDLAAGGSTPMAQLSALTCLHAQTTASLTAGLAALTQLQELVCGMVEVDFSGGRLRLKEGACEWESEHAAPLQAAAAAVLAQLADALPALQALTSLKLPPYHELLGDCVDPVIQQVSLLTRLQRLSVGSNKCAQGWLTSAVLPPTLSALSIVDACEDPYGWARYMMVGPSMPCLQKLAQSGALHDLYIQGCTLDTGLLSSLTSLTCLTISDARLASAPGVPELLALSKLTALQCLKFQQVNYLLPWRGPGAEAARPGWTKVQEAAANSDAMLAAEAAAMTASTRLTRLVLDSLCAPSTHHLFSNGQLCLSLRELVLVNKTPHQLLRCADNAQQMVNCCPGLTRLKLDQDPDCHGMSIHDRLQHGASLRCLTGLQELKSLSLRFVFFDIQPDLRQAVLAALVALDSTLTAFTSLSIAAHELNYQPSNDLLELVRCQQLKCLKLKPKYPMQGSPAVVIATKAPYGSPSDVWRQLLQWMMQKAAANADSAAETADSAQQAVAALLDGVTFPTDAVIEAARDFILAQPGPPDAW